MWWPVPQWSDMRRLMWGSVLCAQFDLISLPQPQLSTFKSKNGIEIDTNSAPLPRYSLILFMDSELSIRQALDVNHLAGEPLPIAPTGYYNWEVSPDPSNSFNGHSIVSNGLTLIESLRTKGFIKPEMSKIVRETCLSWPFNIFNRDSTLYRKLLQIVL